MKKIFFIAIASLFIVSTEGHAQKWLKKIENVAKTVDKVLGGESSATTSDTASSTTNSGTEQQSAGGTKIVTNHPDFIIKLKRCAVSGKTCVIDLLLTNNGSKDVSMRMTGGHYNSSAFDDEGNQYSGSDFKAGMGSRGLTDGLPYPCPLLSNSPLKARIQIEGVAEEATLFTRIQLVIKCDEFGLNPDKKVMLYNIPISREGDE